MLKFDLSWHEDEDRPESAAPAPDSLLPDTEPGEEEAHFGGTLTLTPEESAELEEPTHDDGVSRIEEDFAEFENAAPSPAEAVPAEEPEEAYSSLRKPAEKETVPLSDRIPDPLEHLRTVVAPQPDPLPESEEQPPSGSKTRTFVLAALLVLVAGAAAYMQRDFLLSLIIPKPKPVLVAENPIPSPEPVPQEEPASLPVADSTVAPADSVPVAPETKESPSAPAAPPPEEKKAAASTSPSPAEARPAPAKPLRATPDPVLAALGRIGKATPPRVWLTAADIRADGSYELEGMAFLHEAMGAFVSALEREGSVSSRDIPVKMTSPEAVYRFTVSGRLSGSSGASGTIPSDRLAALGKTLRGLRRAAGMTVVQAPGPGRTVGEQDLPFVVEGTYSGIDDLLGRFLAGKHCIIHRMAIEPAASGKPYNRVRASFSLRSDAAR